MKRTAPIFLLVLAAVALVLPVRVSAQVSEAPQSKQAAASNAEQAPELTLADAESALAALEADTEIEESAKSTLRSKYQQAITVLKEAAGESAKTKSYVEAMSQAPDETVELRKQLQELPSAEAAADVAPVNSLDDLQQSLSEKRGELAALNQQLAGIAVELDEAEQRPTDISARIPEAQRELSDVREQLSSTAPTENDTSASRAADRMLLQAQEAKLLSELEMLEQEQLSMSVRRILQQAQKDLLTRQIENISAAIDAYEALVARSAAKQAQDFADRIAELEAELPADSPARDVVAEVQERAAELISIQQDKLAISAATDSISAKLERLVQRHEGILKQIELGQTDRAMAEVLLKLRDLLDSRQFEQNDETSRPTLSRVRLAAVLVDAAIEEQEEYETRFADQQSRVVDDLIEVRGEILDELRAWYLELLPNLATLEIQQQLYADEVAEIQADIPKHLFWMRVSPPLSVQTLSESPSGLMWVLSPSHGLEFARSMWLAIRQTPYASSAVLILAVALLMLRPAIGAALKSAGEGVGRVSRDHYSLTWKAVFWTVLLAIPIPLLAGFVAVTLSLSDATLDWQKGLRIGLLLLLPSIIAASTAAAVCYPGGLGQKHFGWRPESRYWLRRSSHWFLFVYLPLTLLASCTFFTASTEFLDGAGRISFSLAHGWLAIFLWRLFYSPKGIQAASASKQVVGLFRRFWTLLAVACPIGLIALAWCGYTIAALKLSQLAALTLSLIIGVAILHALVLRWFKIEHRKLALAEALEQRRARQAAVAAEEHQVSSSEVISVDEDEQELDIDSIDGQTRHLLRLLFNLGTAIAVLSLWSETLPLIEYLDSVRIPMTTALTLFDLTKASLIVAVTWIAIKNLPGVLEFAVLRSASIHAGTRNAITTIGQYVLVALAIALLFNVLKLDWTQFGWIAGGLSVGIGFGMQEVVANFVCGLILLFERPLRVGDVVTVEGELGTVTKIHLRATTIINFDRGEVVLPNKTLITSKLVNWTLSSSLNRIAIPVGVAYGTDMEKARLILLEAAADHPLVLKDPAPVAIFSEFADSSLNILLRVYLPDRNNRESTISDLHTDIDRRLAAAGIEIPFPQRDFHLRGGWGAFGYEANAIGGATEREN